ncbi:MAG: hypothetical protein ACI4UO_02820, partial [Paludibacteraceae bacterium]
MKKHQNLNKERSGVKYTKFLTRSSQQGAKRSSLHEVIRKALSPVLCLLAVIGLFAYLAWVMGLANALNTIMNTAHDLLLNTVFYLMGICV